jgi:2-polyprenyl-3-methyl-5-hydroxy-6-metoxy-1,4-benzoquinol methylase
MHKYLEVTYPQTTNYPDALALYLYVHHLPPGAKMLDFGCGRGEYVEAFRKLKMIVAGVDSRIENNCDLGYYKCNIEVEQIPFGDGFFDCIFSKSTIEHVRNTEHMFTELNRVLRPGGKIILMTPEWNPQTFYIDYSHVTPYTVKSLREAMLIFGFKNITVERFYQLPLLWKKPYLTFLAKLTDMFCNYDDIWKDKEQTKHRTWIRFSKEPMLLGIGEK